MLRKKEDTLKLYQYRLQTLEEKRSGYGLDTPLHILAEIEDVRKNIEALQTELKALENSGVDTLSLAKNTDSKQPRVRIIWQGDSSALSADRQSAAIVAFAAVAGIPPHLIKVYVT